MKKLLNGKCLGILFMMFIVSCTSDSDELIVSSGKGVSKLEIETFKVSEEEAKETLIAFMDQFESNHSGDISTRSASRRTIRDIQALRVDRQEVSTLSAEVSLDNDIV